MGDETEALNPGTRVVYDRPDEPGRGEAIIQKTGVDDWEQWYLAEDTETGEDVQIGESSVITLSDTGGNADR